MDAAAGTPDSVLPQFSQDSRTPAAPLHFEITYSNLPDGAGQCIPACKWKIQAKRQREVQIRGKLAAKAKGRYPLRDIAPSVRFSEDPVSAPGSQLTVIPASFRRFELAPATPALRRPHTRCKSFISSIAKPSVSRLLCEFRCRFSLIVPVYSLLLEDFSSVDLKHTPELAERK